MNFSKTFSKLSLYTQAKSLKAVDRLYKTCNYVDVFFCKKIMGTHG